jgi:hypothetical protein
MGVQNEIGFGHPKNWYIWLAILIFFMIDFYFGFGMLGKKYLATLAGLASDTDCISYQSNLQFPQNGSC